MTPKAYLVHASTDKERFVRPLDRYLAAHGVQPILDERDFLGGDFTSQAMFDYGIDLADVVVIVLSESSIASGFVKEEIEHAWVQRAKGKCRLLSILLDAFPAHLVPTALQATIWHRSDDPANLEPVFAKITNAILETRPAPELGDPPPWTQIAVRPLQLERKDEIVFAKACALRLSDVRAQIMYVEPLRDAIREAGLDDGDLAVALQVLADRGFIKAASGGVGNPRPRFISITSHGMEDYLRAYRAKEFALAMLAVTSAIVNEHLLVGSRIQSRLGMDPVMLRCVLESLEFHRHIDLSVSSAGGPKFTIIARPSLRRLLEQ